MATTIENTKGISLWKYSIAGVLAGLITGILNNIWIVVYSAMNDGYIPGNVDTDEVTALSFVPMLLASFVYYLISMRDLSKGTKIYIGIGSILFITSLYFPFFPEQTGLFPVDEIPKDFALFTTPMHVIAAFLALYFIPRFVTKQ